MSAAVFRAELDSGRALTYVAGVEDDLDLPRVYVGSRTTFEDDPAGVVPMSRRFSAVPTVSVDEIVLSPEGARALAERLLLAAMQCEAACECGHAFWEHSDGRVCCATDPDADASPLLCRCGRFAATILTAKVGV